MLEIVFSQTVVKSNSMDVHVVGVLVCVYPFHVCTRACKGGREEVSGWRVV